MKKFFYYLSIIGMGFFIGWELITFFAHWDQVLSRKEELRLHWIPFLGLTMSYIAFMNLKD